MKTMLDAVLFCYSDEFEAKLAETDSEKSPPHTRKINPMSDRAKRIERHRIARKKAVQSNRQRRNPVKYHRLKMAYGDPYADLARRKIEEKYCLARGLKDHVEELEDSY